ncbi:MAG: sigma 54-interacting transcriptional regulator [Desulfovibrionaceae bacterium]
MRYSYPPIAGKILSMPAPFAALSITGRTLAVGIPLLGGLLLSIFWITGRLSDDMINRAIARNTRLQALAISHEFERIIDDTRNQLLVLAAGNMNQSEMSRRLKIRPLVESVRYRELAFLGVSPENRFLLLNYHGEVVTVPNDVAREARLSPFQSFAVERRPGHVVLGEPLEVVYSMVPINGVLQSISLFVIRLTTPVYDAAGTFQGLLILSLDVTTLRDTLSLFTSLRSPLYDPDNGPNKTRSMFFDPQGWVLFQSENPDIKNPPLSTDSVRSGIKGDFGRPSFSSAFRPAPEHEDFWSLVSEIQAGRSGHTFLRGGFTLSGGQVSQQIVSFAPLYFKSTPDSSPHLVGGVALTETSYGSGSPSFHLFGVYAICSLVALFCLTVALYYMGRWLARPVQRFAQAVRAEGESTVPSHLDLQPIPLELGLVQNEVNLLLERIKAMHEETLMREAAVNAQWQRQPMPFTPSLEDALGIVGETPVMQDLRTHIHKAASVFADVLLIGETGTGKEMAADAIHRQSGRNNGPFISINCGALDENLLMDTLFGHVKGAFTEARTERKGAFLAAEGGTLMLDEIANASPKVQQALLRALAIRRIRPLGSDSELPFNARIIAATNVNLLQMAKDTLFREDLFYRLAVITVKTPPLRDHKDDIPLLAQHFLQTAAREQNIQPPQLSKGALDRLVNYDWPGNVRECKNVLIRAMTFSEGSLIYAESIVFGDTSLPKVGTAPAVQQEAADKPAAMQAPVTTPTPSIEQQELNPRQLAALPAIVAAGSISRQEYQDLVGMQLSMRTAQYDLQEMVRLGILVKQGRGPALRYLVAQSCPLP